MTHLLPGATPPSTRAPFGPSGGQFFAWGDFTMQDLFACYPQPRWIRDRLAQNPQAPMGNALLDPLPLPFTRAEVIHALREIHAKRKTRIDRDCAPITPSSVHIALLALPILESRNGGWIDFDAGRPRTEPLFNRPATPRANVFNLRCLLYRLPGKPLSAIARGPCYAPQPRRLGALYNLRDVRTTFAAGPIALPAPFGAAVPFLAIPGMDGPGGNAPFIPLGQADLFGFQVEQEPPAEPDPFTYALFEIYETFDMKGD